MMLKEKKKPTKAEEGFAKEFKDLIESLIDWDELTEDDIKAIEESSKEEDEQ